MRRKDREVTDFATMRQIIDECEIIRIGLVDEDLYPYIVPMNFAYEVEGEQITFYLHGATAGRKYELMQKNKVCSFEMDRPLMMDLVYEHKDVTMRYKSVMGKANIEFLEGEEKLRGLDVLMKRDERTRTFEYNEALLSRVAAIKLTVTEITGKFNKPRQ
ncbi:MAG: pyridoxamine 5'-phosphate oxidase family protein [Clostridia bacterium]|nr:pyridoxamine 5'-phosphate oxidase family protein [Clostridia bacterium]